MASRKVPHGFLNELHNAFQELSTDFQGFVCSELNISKGTYYNWKNNPDSCLRENKRKILKIAYDLVKDRKLLVTRLFKSLAD